MTKINIDSVTDRFKNHLKVDGNYRIIFSGKFGIGKTFFLNKFFDQEDEEYNKIIISPVNYVVNSNEDIFELIKADIIQYLFFNDKIAISPKKKNRLQDLTFFVHEKPQHFLKFITSAFKKVNPLFEIGDNFYDSLKQLYIEFKNYEKKLAKELKIEEDKLSDFFNSFLGIKGTLFENDFITQTLTSVLTKLKNYGKKKNVLIIDDFDRIDPEHIFRILNILSVHNNYYSTENKFSFDHVIIVCDIENIKKIFFHKYGNEVDFDGYIDKFYSTDIFSFSNQDSLKFYIKETFGSDDNIHPDFLVFILNELVDIGELSIRKLLKHQFDINFDKFIIYERLESKSGIVYPQVPITFIADWSRLYVDSDDLPILRFFKLMSFVYGNINIFFESIKKLKAIKKTLEFSEYERLIQFLVLQNHIMTERNDNLFFNKTVESISKQVLRVDYPKVPFLKHYFNIQFQWNGGNKYNSNQSYFTNAKVNSADQVRIINHEAEKIYFQRADILSVVENILFSCNEFGYLENIGVSFQKNNL